jgi:hypothetical protein
MESIQKSLVSILVASLCLYGLWYFYADRFNIGLVQNAESCKTTLNTSEEKVMRLIDTKATAIILGKDVPVTAETPTDTAPESITGIASIQKLLNIDALVDSAISRVKTKILEKQNTDPSSLINTEKNRIHNLYESARSWCDKLPGKKTA